ncbi:hypothetical protein BN2497_559 [Janthinobacterium sp. CG23_2]|nr:hypothetical protein BN2497_559 [Janthinobacterium sp. CG23_2]CUU26677.1 hypothetical protein BN3177_559 [Janthinobacterium sp. CG23_2]
MDATSAPSGKTSMTAPTKILKHEKGGIQLEKEANEVCGLMKK